MPQEVLRELDPQPGGTYLDGTIGGGGHARLILEAAPGGRLIGLDRDPEALRRAAEELAPFGDRVVLRQANFSAADQVLAELEVAAVNGMLLDLGVSSFQLDAAGRGFSFRQDAPLDMRMDPGGGPTAAEVLETLEVDELARIFRQYGEERYARRIARRIARVRRERPLRTTGDLAELVREAVPGGHAPARIHPATRVFQALRIYINDELEHVRRGVRRAIDLLHPEGRLVVISFHSLEDRIVKHLFREEAAGCVCPPKVPVCACGHAPRVALLHRKALRPQAEEMDANPRARSALLRSVRRL